MNWAEFLHMGGHGFYIWLSYAAAAIVLGLNIILPLRRYRALKLDNEPEHESTS
jgi:heme exporter protein D